ncbi:2-keto-3-deoxy-phosphogluconate aldolase [Fervidobacterium changbaicum]|jgi:2-dehydro-3-deoxyphosphogluconate aldolase/(4S)-4-hydroxy-2-oxoglutarate aldolase|uniref:2-keto-3-deoxy-phosphogluconate aldolase n=3 Tax=Fervidobacterium TaxID=2422 RepID=H9U9U8_FERPD|nr:MULTISPECIES: bifunctional 4-hydroxy-2-oxoglutarate aldolase/2-dehydro-3-deoxy-phosphogluconate aldolase [Fervidobacterium]AFG34291.1 2-keto-3-deoxy-phosphogluconate aldolase [Fervidobacterium pennivorans DSM 9078]AMW32016.1 bifunctional 4-hydroxy-2-oxoglutarate aldolase/2-dehydro-3-deoxy-phosphogluconate aldolase [Fervidobacterium islandicum]QAV33798.1 2-dehydro-3-deoxyphosphogluconate aldolase [Fervidobacterium changbaicum]SDH86129.1 2-keto-3-deoxy-phosphogluconate aldolase [Fervidobacteri
MHKDEVAALIEKERFIAILRTSSTEDAVEKGVTLSEEGVKLIEVTFTVPNATEVIKELKERCPDAVIGAGTVINLDMCVEALEAGAEYIISPNFDPEVSKFCAERDICYIPGVMTPTEIVNAYLAGNTILKLFPGDILGPAFIKAMKGPFPNVNFIVTGGVSPDNVLEWLKTGAFGVGMGGSLVSGSKEEVRERIRNVLKKIRELS